MRSIMKLTALLALAACASDTERTETGTAADTSTPPPPPSASAAASDSATAAMGTGAHLNLAPVQGSSETGVSGMAMLTPKAAGETEIAVTVSGKPNATLQAHVHRGRCGNDNGVAMALTPVTTNQDGTGTSATSVPADTVRGEHFVQVHGDGGTPILCADLPGG